MSLAQEKGHQAVLAQALTWIGRRASRPFIRRDKHGRSAARVLVASAVVLGFLGAANGPTFQDIGRPSVAVAASAPGVTVSNTTAGTLLTQMSTNNVWSGMVDQAPNGQATFDGLHAPLVRLHVGDDGYPAAMPEISQGSWSFSALDALVNNVFSSGQKPLMNIKFAPDWMWSCYPNSIGVSGKQGAGQVVDLTFNTYAQYMARLVSYYNKGSMTSESGTVIKNPAGTTHAVTYWELWNEPDLNIETPCAPSNGVGITYQQYVTMWNAVTPAMLAVDPTLKFVGPATAGAQFGSSTTTGNQYVDSLMSGSTVKPAALSFHGYGYWDNTVSDAWIFNGDNSDPVNHCCGGITDLKNGVNAIHAHYPSLPIWLTEVNVNADWGNDTHKRPWDELAAAWWASAFQTLAPLGAGIIYQYDVADGPQFGTFDSTTGAPYMSYYVTELLDQAFPQGSTLLSSSSTQSGIVSLAAQKPDGTISVLVANTQLSSGASNCGTGGVAATVPVNFSGFTSTAITLQQLDKNNVNCSTNFAIAPTTQTLSASSPVSLSFPGYGMAILNISTSGAAPLPTATASPTVAATSTATQVPATATPTTQPTVAPQLTATSTSVPATPVPATSTPVATIPLATVATTSTPAPASAPGGVFADSFESDGALPGTWTSKNVSSGNSLTLDSTMAHSGTISLKAVTARGSAGNAKLTKTLSTGQGKLDVRGYYYLNNPVNWGAVQLMSLYSGSNFLGWVTYNVDPQTPSLQFYNGANNQWYTCGQVPTLNAWHSIEVQYTASTTSGAFTLWLDGAPVCQQSGVRTLSQSGLINRVVVGVNSADSSVGLTVHVDDVVVSTGYVGP